MPLILQSEEGTISIEGETLLVTFDHHQFEMADIAVLEQCAVRYRWDGEETIGLMERCTLKAKLPSGQPVPT